MIEFPETRQRAERDVEFSLGPLADLSRRLQHVAHLGARVNGAQPRRLIQALDVAARTPDTHQIFEALEFGKDVIERRYGAGLVTGPRSQTERRTHREPRSLDEVRRRRWVDV